MTILHSTLASYLHIPCAVRGTMHTVKVSYYCKHTVVLVSALQNSSLRNISVDCRLI